MLVELRIRNVAVIDTVVLPLAAGLNVLTGETGAGKSLIVGALGMLLGERAATDRIRSGADKATVEGVFEPGAMPSLRAMLGPLLDAVELLHQAGCVHRDIAPDNLIVRPDGSAVLLDFGAARQTLDALAATSSEAGGA